MYSFVIEEKFGEKKSFNAKDLNVKRATILGEWDPVYSHQYYQINISFPVEYVNQYYYIQEFINNSIIKNVEITFPENKKTHKLTISVDNHIIETPEENELLTDNYKKVSTNDGQTYFNGAISQTYDEATAERKVIFINLYGLDTQVQ